MIQILINDSDKNLTLYQSHHALYHEYIKRRINREQTSFLAYMNAEFPNPILPSLDELNNLIDSYYEAKQQFPQNASFYDNKIANIQGKIDNGQYITEVSPEWSTKLARDAKKAAFVWPSQEELDIRAQEEQELLVHLA